MNMQQNVNEMAEASAGGYVKQELRKLLLSILGSVPWLHNWEIVQASAPGWDFCVTGHLPDGGRTHWWIECKSQLSPSQFLQLQQRHGRDGNSLPILAMPRVSPRMAELCQEHGWGWFDLAGNCHLEVPGFLFIERTGRPPVPIEKLQEVNLGTPEASRVVRALLAPENAGRRWTQRDLVDHFQPNLGIRPPSLALVNKVVQYLKKQAYIEYLPDRGLHLSDPERLLKAWCLAYPHKRHLRRRYFTLLQGRTLQERLWRLALTPLTTGKACYMSFSAADFQAANVRQPRTWLYVAAEQEENVRASVDAKIVDSGENLMVLIPFDSGVFYGLDLGEKRLACSNPVQTYLDLMHTAGRGEEAAYAILEQRLRPAWRKG